MSENALNNAYATSVSVLLVEDNPSFEQSLVESLNALGLDKQITICNHGAHALRHLRAPDTQVDLVLVDIGLPDISGIEVVDAAHRRFKDAMILVISVVASEKSVIDAIRLGARGYLNKGDSSMAITQAIKDLMNGNFPISPSLARSLFKLAGSPVVVTKDEDTDFYLTAREIETLKLIGQGNSYTETANMMGVKLSTIQTNIRNIYRKLEVKNQMLAVDKARKAGLI
jgi:hypothetical protein